LQDRLIPQLLAAVRRDLQMRKSPTGNFLFVFNF